MIGTALIVGLYLYGLIMWVPGNIIFIIIMSALFLRWMQKKEREQAAQERELYEAEDVADLPVWPGWGPDCQGDRKGRPYYIRAGRGCTVNGQGRGDPCGRPGSPYSSML